jgi:hypothetical protein
LAGRIFAFGSVCGKAVEAGLFEAGLAGLADGFSSSGVFVVGGDVADAGVRVILWGSPGRSRVDLRVSAAQRLIAERY